VSFATATSGMEGIGRRDARSWLLAPMALTGCRKSPEIGSAILSKTPPYARWIGFLFASGKRTFWRIWKRPPTKCSVSERSCGGGWLVGLRGRIAVRALDVERRLGIPENCRSAAAATGHPGFRRRLG